MKRYLLFLLFISPSSFSDPFYKEDPENQPTQEITKETAKLTACKPLDDVEYIHIPVDFNQLKLVGIIKIDQQFKALFLDKENRLIDLKPNDYMATANIQVKQIDLKSITLIDWNSTTDCSVPSHIQMKL